MVAFPMLLEGLDTAAFSLGAQSGVRVSIAKAVGVHRTQISISSIINATHGVRFSCAIYVHGNTAATQVDGTILAVMAAPGGAFAELVRHEMARAVIAAGESSTFVALTSASIVQGPTPHSIPVWINTTRHLGIFFAFFIFAFFVSGCGHFEGHKVRS
jgi:hypothetical protein